MTPSANFGARNILDVLPYAVIVIDRDWKVMYQNAEASHIHQGLGYDLWQGWPEFAKPEARRCLERTMFERTASAFEVQRDRSANCWLSVRTSPCETGLTVTVRDISAEKATEAELLRREDELKDFMENAALGFHWVAEDGTILWANDTELRLLGYSAEEYIGHNVAEFHADQHVIADILRRLQGGETLHGYESRMRCKDGSIRHVCITSNVRWNDGKFVHTRCLTRDITEEKRAEELQQRLAAIVESSDDAIISNSLTGIIQSWNPAAARLFGYSSEEAIGQPIAMLTPPHHADDFQQVLSRIARGERVDSYQTGRKRKDGAVITVSMTVSAIRDGSGQISAASVVVRDVGDQRKLGEVRDRLAAIVESSDDAIISKDLNGIIQSWNRGAERIFGYTAPEVIGRHVSMLAVPERAAEIPVILGRIARGERVEHHRTERRTKDGRVLTVSLTVSPVRDETGTIIGASKIARDITEQERSERILRETNLALTEANRDLEQFAYSASHDLQEPLRMVSIYSEMLHRKFSGQLGPTGEEYLNYAVQGARRMERLLQDLLAYVHVSSTKQSDPGVVNAEEVLTGALANLEMIIDENDAVITRDALPSVRIPAVQLEQLFQNLIANAIRYRNAEPPIIHIGCESAGAGMCQISVRDNGIGIDPQYKEQIFGIFKRLHTAADYPGTGMGLAICERIVQRAGGRIWVESEPGKGSTFFFTLRCG